MTHCSIVGTRWSEFSLRLGDNIAFIIIISQPLRFWLLRQRFALLAFRRSYWASPRTPDVNNILGARPRLPNRPRTTAEAPIGCTSSHSRRTTNSAQPTNATHPLPPASNKKKHRVFPRQKTCTSRTIRDHRAGVPVPCSGVRILVLRRTGGGAVPVRVASVVHKLLPVLNVSQFVARNRWEQEWGGGYSHIMSHHA